MKKGIHPDYHKVLFVDTATEKRWVGRSTLTSDKTEEVDGEELPVVRLELSAESHPFWTGQARVARGPRGPLPQALRHLDPEEVAERGSAAGLAAKRKDRRRVRPLGRLACLPLWNGPSGRRA
jgi:large subunit ribosomal protein L31